MGATTPTGIPVEECGACGVVHPVTRAHCEVCGRPSLFPHHIHASEAAEAAGEEAK